MLKTSGTESGSEDKSLYENRRIEVGEAFQADIPDCDPDQGFNASDHAKEGFCFWRPNPKIHDREEAEHTKLRNFLENARRDHQIDYDQGLGIYFYNNYNMAKAKNDLSNYVPATGIWSESEVAFFFCVRLYCAKNFADYLKYLPNKTLPEIVLFYYLMKNKDKMKSVMDKEKKSDEDRKGTALASLQPRDGSVEREEDGTIDLSGFDQLCGVRKKKVIEEWVPGERFKNKITTEELDEVMCAQRCGTGDCENSIHEHKRKVQMLKQECKRLEEEAISETIEKPLHHITTTSLNGRK